MEEKNDLLAKRNPSRYAPYPRRYGTDPSDSHRLHCSDPASSATPLPSPTPPPSATPTPTLTPTLPPERVGGLSGTPATGIL